MPVGRLTSPVRESLASYKVPRRILVFLDDNSEDLAETRAFLGRRIDDVMRFEKVKASWRGSRDRRFSMSRFLGRLRYPVT